jgi:uncharacterized glyoxalase superfamily protein PhnB
MAALHSVQCVLAVPDLANSIAFYAGQLGMSLDMQVTGWAFLSRDGFRLMLGECPDAIPPKALGDHSYFAYVNVSDVDGLHEELFKNGVEIHHPLASKPWGMREFGISTPDGHRIMFGQEDRLVGSGLG